MKERETNIERERETKKEGDKKSLKEEDREGYRGRARECNREKGRDVDPVLVKKKRSTVPRTKILKILLLDYLWCSCSVLRRRQGTTSESHD